MATYSVTPLEAVGFEGLFGLLTVLLVSPVLIHFKSKSDFFDLPRGWHQMTTHPAVLGSAIAIATSIGFYNFFGMSVTRHISATMRSIIDTCRTITIWIVSLGLGWEMLVWPWSLLQVIGFSLLVCVFQFCRVVPKRYADDSRADHTVMELSCSIASFRHPHSFAPCWYQSIAQCLQMRKMTKSRGGAVLALASKIEGLQRTAASISLPFFQRTWDKDSMFYHLLCQRLTQDVVTRHDFRAAAN